MKSVFRMSLVLLAVALACPGWGAKMSAAVPKGWGEDFEAAKKAAAAEGKLVFLAFSGSDWCGWCVKLEREVYSQTEFVNKAKRRFVLTMIDNPRDEERLSDLAKRQNRELTRRFGVRGFPCGMVCDAKGNVLGQIGGYVMGGPDEYLKRMLAFAPAAPSAAKDRKSKDNSAQPERKD